MSGILKLWIYVQMELLVIAALIWHLLVHFLSIMWAKLSVTEFAVVFTTHLLAKCRFLQNSYLTAALSDDNMKKLWINFHMRLFCHSYSDRLPYEALCNFILSFDMLL